VLAICDPFDGTVLNNTIWAKYAENEADGCYPGHGGNGLRCTRAVSVAGGNLVVTATPSTQTITGKLESGGVATRSYRRYGRWETRIRVDDDPTVTMSAVAINWNAPTSIDPTAPGASCEGEADYYETGAGAGNRLVTGFLHYEIGTPNCSDTTTQAVCPTRASVFARDWHDITLEWGPSLWRVTVDGNVTCNITNPDLIPQWRQSSTFQLDAFSCGTPDRTNGSVCPDLNIPVKMQVAYSRIYDRSGGL
jgi:endo-1,3-1,4-beta-glycanase ExoK